MQILIATHNPSKLIRYQQVLKSIPEIDLTSLSQNHITQKVDEPFLTAKENAIYKAKQYALISGLPTLAIDEGVTTNFLPPDEQPGVFVKRLRKNNEEGTDEEIIEHWEKIFKKYPQKNKKFIWDFSVAFYNPQTKFLGYDQSIRTNTVAETFSSKRSPGYPMASFLIPEGMNKPYIDLSEKERLIVDRETFKMLIPKVQDWINA